MKMFQKLFLALGVVCTLFVAVGLFLPRQWTVKAEVSLPTANAAKAFELISNFPNWSQWAIWGLDDPSYQVEFSETHAVPGSWMRWKGKKTGYGQLTLTQVAAPTLIRYDGAIESDTQNSNGEIQIQIDPDDKTQSRVIWIDQGELPPIIGGYFKSLIEASLTDHFQKSLNKLTESSL